MYTFFIVGLPYASSAVRCLSVRVVRTLFFCRAANSITTQMNNHRYAPAKQYGDGQTGRQTDRSTDWPSFRDADGLQPTESNKKKTERKSKCNFTVNSCPAHKHHSNWFDRSGFTPNTKRHRHAKQSDRMIRKKKVWYQRVSCDHLLKQRVLLLLLTGTSQVYTWPFGIIG
jgi:hypothetical protein